MKGYEVRSNSTNRVIEVYATKRRAETLILDNPLLFLRMNKIKLSFGKWLFLKLMFQ